MTKISQLTALGSALESNDQLFVRDISDASVPVKSVTPENITDTLVKTGDIGTAPNQIPLNQHLGTMAFQDAASINVGQIGADGSLPVLVDRTERLRIDSSGNVGIGTSSPGAKLHAAGTLIATGDATLGGNSLSISGVAGSYSFINSTSGYLQITSAGNTLIDAGASGNLIFRNSTTERLRIDSSGRLLVGTSSYRSFQWWTNLKHQIEGTGETGGSLSLFTNSNDIYPSALVLGKSRGTSLGSVTAVNSGDGLGEITFFGADGTASIRAAAISAAVDGTPGTNDMPGRLVFSTTADGASSPTERMRITSTGQVRLAGAGITFNGDTATANELDDYEEGTWTPTVEGSSTAGTATYSERQGRYTKVGRMVHFEGYVAWTGGTGTGNLRVSGLPFTASNSATFPGVSLGFANDLTTPANTIPVACVESNNTYIRFSTLTIAGGTTGFLAYDAAGSIPFSGCYSV